MGRNGVEGVTPEEALRLAVALGGLRDEDTRHAGARGLPLFEEDEGPERRRAWLWHEVRRGWK